MNANSTLLREPLPLAGLQVVDPTELHNVEGGEVITVTSCVLWGLGVGFGTGLLVGAAAVGIIYLATR